jgi:hypothetical protein
MHVRHSPRDRLQARRGAGRRVRGRGGVVAASSVLPWDGHGDRSISVAAGPVDDISAGLDSCRTNLQSRHVGD